MKTLDVAIIGAGFAGMYALHRMRGMGLSVRAFDGAGGVGGTWWWNRYPGARVDFPSAPYYAYSFSKELNDDFVWKETQPTQAEVLSYLDHCADKLDLRSDIELETWIYDPRFDEETQRWEIETSRGDHISAQFLVCAMGSLFDANTPPIPGIEDFSGELYHTGRWPQDEVIFAGKRVGVIGTGSSGIQAIPVIASEAGHLTVFQRTPQYSIPAGNRPLEAEEWQAAIDEWDERRAAMDESPFGLPYKFSERSALEDTPDQRQKVYEEQWQRGGLHMLFSAYNDLLLDKRANDTIAEFIRGKIREIVKDPETVEKLLPDYLLGTKRQVIDNGYFETYNRDNVALVDLRKDPIHRITADSVITESGEHPLDMLVLATGFDALTGAYLKLNPTGRGGARLANTWRDRFSTYLGMVIPGFPNLFMIHGPQSPSVLFNMPLGAEREGDWICDCIRHMRENDLGAIEPAEGVEEAWAENVDQAASATLFHNTDSWYSGANIEGKHRQFIVHLGGQQYFQHLRDVADAGYEGFVTEKA